MIRSPLIAALLALLAILAWAAGAQAAEPLRVRVASPYLEMRSGPGRGYPVFHVAARDELVDVLVRRTDWFKVRTDRGVEGWAAHRDMLQTLHENGSPFTYPLADRAAFVARRFETGVLWGDYSGATLVSAYGSVALNPQLALELSLGQFLGDASNGLTADLGLAYTFVPQWRLSPFAMLGTGVVHVDPKATLVEPVDRTDQTAYAGGGVRLHLARRLLLRAEYKSHVVFTSRDDNEETDEWKLGFAFFF